MGNMPKYQQVRQHIVAQIDRGELKPGDKLPAEEEYVKSLGVSSITVRKALTDLAADGLISRVKGTGSFVSDHAPEQQSSRLIALVLSAEDYRDASYMSIIRGAQQMVADFGYSLIIEWSDQSIARERSIIQKMIDRQVDGFLIYPFDPVRSEPNFALIEGQQIPYVLIDRYNPDHPTYFAGSNNYEGGSQATKKLLQMGHTKIKFAGFHFFLSSERERFDGYCSAMREAGLPITSESLLNPVDFDLLAESVRREETTAVFCCNDKLATKVVTQLLERGVRVPEDVSILGFDDWEDLRHFPIGLSTVRQDFERLGGHAANLLLSAVNGSFTDHNTKILAGVELVLRDSTAEYPGPRALSREAGQ